MELQRKEEKKDEKHIGKLIRKNTKKCLLTLVLKSIRSKVKGKHSAGKEFQKESRSARKETLDIDILITSKKGNRKIMQLIRVNSGSSTRIRNCSNFR